MSKCSQVLWRVFPTVLVMLLFGMPSVAKGTAEVGAFREVSAFPVLTDGCPSSPVPGPDASGAEYATPADTVAPDAPQRTAEAAESGAELSDPDSLQMPLDTARLQQISDSLKGAPPTANAALQKPRFVPDPKRALWLSLVLPGAGQIYNRKFWKLPFVYGGFLGCAYALMWNQMMYRDYSQAYLDIMDDDPNTDSYLDMLPPRYDITGREEQFQTIFKRKKDYYRRYRDLSAFCFIGVYLLSVIDAYVDAQLSVFDISSDLTMSVEPAVIGSPATLGQQTRAAYGVGCSLRF